MYFLFVNFIIVIFFCLYFVKKCVLYGYNDRYGGYIFSVKRCCYSFKGFKYFINFFVNVRLLFVNELMVLFWNFDIFVILRIVVIVYCILRKWLIMLYVEFYFVGILISNLWVGNCRILVCFLSFVVVIEF